MEIKIRLSPKGLRALLPVLKELTSKKLSPSPSELFHDEFIREHAPHQSFTDLLHKAPPLISRERDRREGKQITIESEWRDFPDEPTAFSTYLAEKTDFRDWRDLVTHAVGDWIDRTLRSGRMPPPILPVTTAEPIHSTEDGSPAAKKEEPQALKEIPPQTLSPINRPAEAAPGGFSPWDYLDVAAQGGFGVIQGSTNIINGVQDIGTDIANLPSNACNWTWGRATRLSTPTFKFWDWSRDSITQESQSLHDARKFIGGNEAVFLGTWRASAASAASKVGTASEIGNVVVQTTRAGSNVGTGVEIVRGPASAFEVTTAATPLKTIPRAASGGTGLTTTRTGRPANC